MKLAREVDKPPEKPRTTRIQRHRANAGETDSVEDYFRINLFISFLDHILLELNEKFRGNLCLLFWFLIKGNVVKGNQYLHVPVTCNIIHVLLI